MENSHTSASEGHESNFSTKIIWRTFWILLIITVIELILAIVYYETHFISKHLLNGLFVIGTLAKAFFIIAEFMHLGHEIRNLIMTIAIPAMLFIWFLAAFLWDGNSYKNLRNKYDPYHVQQDSTKAPVKEGEHQQEEEHGKKPGVE
ncbi:MAG: cytochrome C oxidase subunit IV family protein [Bacteroidetes bacterium]|nr:cytochrome C oxidase subunit IV family protein [Bacteroidota bacterium]